MAKPKWPIERAQITEIVDEGPWIGAAGLTMVADRVMFIVDLMIENLWEKRVAKQLADEWDVSASQIRQYSAEASRFINANVENRGTLIAKNIAKLAYWRDHGSEKGSIMATAELDKISGAGKVPMLEGPTEEAKRAGMLKAIGLCDPKLWDVMIEGWSLCSDEVLQRWKEAIEEEVEKRRT